MFFNSIRTLLIFIISILLILFWRFYYLDRVVEFSHESGFYDDSFELILESNLNHYSIHYTLDGSKPKITSPLYQEPILIDGNNNNSNSLIPTTPLEGADHLYKFIWWEPKEIKKTTIINFALFKNGFQISPVYHKTYFVNNDFIHDYQFPVISLITDSLNLFDFDNGIYVPGKKHEQDGFNYFAVGNYHNRGSDWERKANITYFNDIGEIAFQTDVGVRIRGYSSASFPQKSFNVYFKNKYGLDTIEHSFFSNSSNNIYKRLILRNSGSDFFRTHFRDAMLQDLLSSMNLEIQRFSPSVLFINGEYWGIHNVREKYDKYYFKYNHAISEDNINIIGVCGNEVEEGSIDNYVEIEEFVKNNDMSILKNYNFLKSKIDLDNFIDFFISQIYYAHYDWPCNNYKMWKTNDPSSKWRFLIYDLDASFGHDPKKSDYTSLSMEHATSLLNDWPYCTCSNLLFRSMLENEEFEKEFLTKFKYHLDHTFSAESVLNKIDEYQSLFETEMINHINRWRHPNSIDLWYEEINKLKHFAINRPCVVKENIIDFFDLDDFDFSCL